MSDAALPNRLRAGSKGLGAPSVSEIEIRALELAKSDGRSLATEADFDRATAELSGYSGSLPVPELINPAVERLTTWDEPADAPGIRTRDNQMEDEVNVAEQLIEEGMREADHDSRVAAAEEAEQRES